MTQKYIIISEDTVNKTIIFEKITNMKILPKTNIQIPICVKFGNYTQNKILYKSQQININNINEIVPNIEKIINKICNDSYFDILTIEIVSDKNIEYYDLPSYNVDNNYINNKLISLYESYLQLDNNIIINIINNSILNNYTEIINNNKLKDIIIINLCNNEEEILNIELTEYKKYFYICNENYKDLNEYFKSLANNENENIDNKNENIDNENVNIDNKNVKINNILNKLYLDLDNYQELLETNYEKFYDHIYISDKYRHYYYYKTINNKNIEKENTTNYNLLSKYEKMKKENSINNELLEEYKDYEIIINKSIEIFDELFDYYIKKLEPEILKYFITMYYNSKDYSNEFESNKDYEFILMLKGLRKMCISLVKKKIKKEYKY